jgi:hypothetical protein
MAYSDGRTVVWKARSINGLYSEMDVWWCGRQEMACSDRHTVVWKARSRNGLF